jgi:hypothetical protein
MFLLLHAGHAVGIDLTACSYGFNKKLCTHTRNGRQASRLVRVIRVTTTALLTLLGIHVISLN